MEMFLKFYLKRSYLVEPKIQVQKHTCVFEYQRISFAIPVVVILTVMPSE